jgi:hypothetical protein
MCHDDGIAVDKVAQVGLVDFPGRSSKLIDQVQYLGIPYEYKYTNYVFVCIIYGSR